ncbi:hypothetical protein PFTANZ_02803 [Plasmodium falciparum Tanzania (2000708)]|uniref:Uncharacterized protein n=1 Tax=Plasmodium falciparum Tanzania (2000708) TaxID=1036725 RepID=A0A024W737_PLAFA|nr:hypothetical protein PFTANZ_02803 [Plasmodium falciparum Tanzania (2000708)]
MKTNMQVYKKYIYILYLFLNIRHMIFLKNLVLYNEYKKKITFNLLAAIFIFDLTQVTFFCKLITHSGIPPTSEFRKN